MKIAIVTDSTSDISPELAQVHNIFLVPNTIVIDNKSYLDGIDITREEFYRLLPGVSAPPTTATASPGAYFQLYKDLIQQGYERIISIHASSLLSGIFNAASAAAQAFNKVVNVIDSQQVSMGLGFQALTAAEGLANGENFETILSLLGSVRERVRVVAMLDTLEYVRRSGRVSWARANIGNLFQVKAFVEIQAGKVLSLGETRTRHKGVERLKVFLARLGNLEKLAILHTNAENDALQFLQSIDIPLVHKPYIINVTPVIGTHVGPNGLGFAAVTR